MSLKKLALITAVMGIAALIFLSNAMEPKTIKIYNIDGRMIGEYVKVSGDIDKIKQSSITLFTIKDDSGDIYAFSYEKLNLTKGSYEVMGKVNEWHGVLEIEVSKIKRLD